VFRHVLVRVGNRQVAEDLTADTFVRALGGIATGNQFAFQVFGAKHPSPESHP
jgi:DNA-directed RNA polymerase specialized sigma24 family protein